MQGSRCGARSGNNVDPRWWGPQPTHRAARGWRHAERRIGRQSAPAQHHIGRQNHHSLRHTRWRRRAMLRRPDPVWNPSLGGARSRWCRREGGRPGDHLRLRGYRTQQRRDEHAHPDRKAKAHDMSGHGHHDRLRNRGQPDGLAQAAGARPVAWANDALNSAAPGVPPVTPRVTRIQVRSALPAPGPGPICASAMPRATIAA